MTTGGDDGIAPLISRDFFARPSAEVAPDLLGCVLAQRTAAGLVAVELTEVEAYAGEADPASHAYRGRTRRNAVMYGPPGHAYVYFTYGMHFCVNLVCLGEGTASAVLLRAGAVVAGEDLARARRSEGRAARDGVRLAAADAARLAAADAARLAARDGARLAARDLARGPARLCQALGIDRSQDGADVCAEDSPFQIRAGARSQVRSAKIRSGPRVGVATAAEIPWRFWLDGEPTVSVYRAHVPRLRGAPPGARRAEGVCGERFPFPERPGGMGPPGKKSGGSPGSRPSGK